MAARPAKTDSKEAVRNAQRSWLREVLATSGATASQLAQHVGISDTTLTRFLNKPDYDGTLTPTVVLRISEYSGIAGPGAPTLPMAMRAMREDGARYISEAADPRAATLSALLAGRNNAHIWEMKSDILALAGIRNGDLLIIDQTVTPRDGDIVCAQIEQGLGARTVFRLYRAPHLVAASFDPSEAKPEIIDGERVRIAGVMTDLLRRR